MKHSIFAFAYHENDEDSNGKIILYSLFTKLIKLTTSNRDNNSDEIDLFAVIERSLLFLRKFRWLFIVAIILGLALGIFAYKSIPKTYRSRIIAHSNILTNQEHIQIVNNWDRLLKNREFASLATILNSREEILHRVKRIKADEIQKVFTPNNPHGFSIDVLVTDNSVLDDLQKGIVYGLENGEYVKQRLAERKENLVDLIQETGEEIKELDSTRKRLVEILSGNGRMTSPLIVGGSNINNQLIEMNEKLLGYKQELKFTNSVHILQGFSKFSKPDGPKLIPWLVIGLLFSLSIAWVYSLISSINQGLKTRARERKSAVREA